MNANELMMWAYQSNFQIEAQVAAESIFKLLDARLAPKVFLIGVSAEQGKDRQIICLEPEDCGFKPEKFNNLKEKAARLEAADQEKAVSNGHPITVKRHLGQLKLRALRLAAEQLMKIEDERRGLISFCSTPVLVEGHHVMVTLQLKREIFDSIYSLLKKRRGSMNLATSLLDATIAEYLDRCQEALSKPNPGQDFRIIDREPSEIVRSAGKTFMYVPAYEGREMIGLYGLFEACNMISSLRYEGAESVGSMIVARKGHPNIEVALSLSEPVLMRDYRAVRKLLELTSGEKSLLSDSGYIYGLGSKIKNYDKNAEDMFFVNFTSNYNWEILHAGNVMMRVAYGQPGLPKPRIDKTKFEKDVRRIFSKINDGEVTRLWEVVLEAIKQKHGTMVVVSEGAEKEAERLKSQATSIKPLFLTADMINMITAIDGAVLVDPRSICFAIGVILDGLASKNGMPSSGARYNSAVKYVESSEYPCIAIVVSEDGSIDLVSGTTPQ